MADSTVDGFSPAWVERARDATALARGIRPVWVAALAIVAALTLAVVAAQAGDADLQGAQAAEVQRVLSLESTLRTQQLLDARAAIQLEDLRARADDQLAALASSEGFLK